MMWKIGKIFRMRMTNEEKFLIHRRTKNISTIFSSWISLFLICHSVLTPCAAFFFFLFFFTGATCRKSLQKINSTHVSFLYILFFILAMNPSYKNCDNMLIFLHTITCHLLLLILPYHHHNFPSFSRSLAIYSTKGMRNTSVKVIMMLMTKGEFNILKNWAYYYRKS